MNFHNPSPLVELTVSEIEDIIQTYIEGLVPPHLRVGNMVRHSLREMEMIGNPRTRLAGSITFELLPAERK